MIYSMNATHDAALRSWVESANASGADFPIQNLPFGVYKIADSSESPRVGVAIGDQVLDLVGVAADGGMNARAQVAVASCRSGSLNRFMAQVPSAWSAVRGELSRILSAESPPDQRDKARKHLTPMSAVTMLLPARIGDYSDFYASIHHATNVGKLLRPDNPLLPNYKYVPIGYHGRSSSIVVSGAAIRRPRGQRRLDGAKEPDFGPTGSLDYELEVGFFTGEGNPLGVPIPLDKAEEHLFGVCLLNDWSARDIQSWEYQPLGPFLAKNFATSISPWIVTLEALEPFRAPAFVRPAGDPPPLPYLESPQQATHGGFDITLQVFLSSRKMREQGTAPAELCRSNLRDLYWTPAQLLAHHASNGCNLRPGDLLGSGTVSGESKESRGCLLERTWRGTEPLTLPSGESRRWLEDGDEVILRGICDRPGFTRISLGECRGTVEGAATA
jgi:fumarylacetoacetase